MKRAYWLLLLFAAWCIACAVWYMFAIKGLPRDINYFSPHPTLMAIAEVLVMMLIACLIGYGIGLSLRDGQISSLEESISLLETERANLLKKIQLLEEQLEVAKRKWGQAEHQQGEESLMFQRKIDLMKAEITSLQNQVVIERDKEKKNPILDQLESETQDLRYKTRNLESQNQEFAETIRGLKTDLENALAARRRVDIEPVHPFIRPVTEDEKDDLTRIKGIGPFIEKRLNMVGIYTLRQISEFTSETIDQVTKAIEFFPNRMVRDNWVGQAKELLEE